MSKFRLKREYWDRTVTLTMKDGCKVTLRGATVVDTKEGLADRNRMIEDLGPKYAVRYYLKHRDGVVMEKEDNRFKPSNDDSSGDSGDGSSDDDSGDSSGSSKSGKSKKKVAKTKTKSSDDDDSSDDSGDSSGSSKSKKTKKPKKKGDD